MNKHPTTNESDSADTRKLSAKWNELRHQVGLSSFAGVKIRILAQNVGMKWAWKSLDAAPEAYLDYSFEQLQALPGFAGNPARVRGFIAILERTLEFEMPFRDMITSGGRKDSEEVLRLLAPLDLPPEWPVHLIPLQESERKLYQSDGVETLQDLILFLRKLAQSVVLNGAFRRLLNSLVERDEGGLAEFLPIRPGSKGLHLAQAIGLMAGMLSEEEKAVAIRHSGLGPSAEEAAILRKLSPGTQKDVATEVQRRLEEVLARFPDERDRLHATSAPSLERFLMPLEHSDRERLAIACLLLTTGQPVEAPSRLRRFSAVAKSLLKGSWREQILLPVPDRADAEAAVEIDLLRTELEGREKELREAETSLRAREKFVEASETALLEKSEFLLQSEAAWEQLRDLDISPRWNRGLHEVVSPGSSPC